MSEPSLQLGNGNWAGKSDNLLAYHKANNNFYADDLTFARASTGTIVNADGLIEQVPYNLLQYSEQFDNAYWTKSAVTVTSGFTSPDGTANAFKLVEDTSTADHRMSTVGNYTAGSHSYSFYVKKAETRYIRINAANTSTYGVSSVFDLVNKTVVSAVGSAKIETLADGWLRCTVTGATIASATTIYLGLSNDGTTFVYTGDGTSGVYIYGAQLNSGSTAKTYYPTTTRLNIPRVDYLNNTNGSLLLEPQRTNLVTYSEDFSNAAWTKSEVTVTTNSTTSPDGTTNADTLLGNGSSSTHNLSQTISVTNAATYSLSIYAKKGTNNFIQFAASSGLFGTNFYANFDINNGSVGSVGTSSTASILDMSNGWYKCTITGTAIATTSGNIAAVLISASTSVRLESITLSTSVYIYGAQVELGSYSTSYIPTSGTTVTRLADTSATTGLSDVINSTEGVLYAEIAGLTDDGERRYISLNDGTANNDVRLYLSLNGYISVLSKVSGTTQVFLETNAYTQTDYNKVAFKYKENDFALWINGVKIQTDTSGLVNASGSLNRLNFDRSSGTLPFYGKVKTVAVFKEALTDTELATLTTI